MIPSRRFGSALSSLSAASCLFLLAPLFSGSLSAQISPEAGTFYEKQYLPDAYGESPQNWAAVQDSRGFMYFGNTHGVLEYSGSKWRTIPLNNGVRSLTVDSQGTVYVGGQGEIGYLKADQTGTLNYASLLDQIPAKDRAFGDVWNVYSTQAGVLFGSSERIFRWSPNGLKVWRPAAGMSFGFLFLVDGAPYVQANGLCRIVGDLLEPVPGGEIFQKHNEIRGILEFSGSLTLATSDGLYRSDGKRFTRWVTGADDLLRDGGIYKLLRLRNGDLAVGTIHGGLVLLTPDGRLDRLIKRESGLPSDAINGIYEDRDASLWLMLSKGIAHVEIELPLTHFGDHEGLEEIVLSIQRQNGNLYAGTMTGLNRLVTSRVGGSARFEPVSVVRGQVFALLSTPRSLLAAGQLGIYEVTSEGVKAIFSGDLIYDLCLSMYDSNLLYAVGRRGLHVLRQEHGDWREVNQVGSEGREFRSVLDDADGKIWVTTSAARILRITLNSGGNSVESFTAKEGVPSPGWRNVAYRLGTRILFATPKGLRQFDRERKMFVPFEAFGPMFADGTRSVSIVRMSQAGDIWISGDGYNGILHNHSSNAYTWEENPLARSEIKEIYALYPDAENVVWAAGSDGGLVRSKVWDTSAPATPFRAWVQDVQFERGEQTLYGGAGTLASFPKIPHARNTLRFEFAAPVFDDESRTKYQVRLDKLDHGWSEWSSESRKEYTNLWEGGYVFHVRARDIYGRISAEDSFSFDVLAPWFRRWWAYLLYAAGLLTAVSAVIRWRLRALAEANRRLEVIVAERTEEIRQQRDTIKQDEEKARALLLNILPASVAEELSATGSVTPLGYDDISVCFTDFVGFTLSSEGLPPADLVAALHRYFTAFDEITARYGLEKLKTIGDSYMFVSGLPNRTPSHAIDAVMAALEIADYVVSVGDSKPGWKIRIGIHSGPVVAGVVGVRKFAFDIWGETVNFASRFESSGSANRVNISALTYELVRDFIDCEARGPIVIKEGRKLEMYFARGILPELLDGYQEGVPSGFSKLYYQRFGRLPRAVPHPRSSSLVSAVGVDRSHRY